MKNRMKKEFLGFEGGLFSEVEKADVGDSFAKLAENGVALMDGPILLCLTFQFLSILWKKHLKQ